MFYKTINKDCEIYKTLKNQREKELEAVYYNKKRHLIHNEKYRGFVDQGAKRIAVPTGFYFLCLEEVALNIWRKN